MRKFLKKRKTQHTAVFEVGIESKNIDTEDEIEIRQIFIRLFGKTITMEVELSDTILSLKEQIYRREYIKVAHQRMVYAGKDLENDKSLFDYNINKESTIVLLPRFFCIDEKAAYLMHMRHLLDQQKSKILGCTRN